MKLRIPALTKALDAGLVKTVEALLRAGQFPRVANLVAASEPLADFALRRMREIVGDQLLVRTAAGLELTRRARRLAAPFRDLLERIGEVLSGRDVFDPAFCEETFHVAASDYASFVLGPGLAARLAESAPRASLVLSPLDVTAMRRPLETGALDLALGPAPRGATGRLKSERLLAERLACIARKGHPRDRQAAHCEGLTRPRGTSWSAHRPARHGPIPRSPTRAHAARGGDRPALPAGAGDRRGLGSDRHAAGARRRAVRRSAIRSSSTARRCARRDSP